MLCYFYSCMTFNLYIKQTVFVLKMPDNLPRLQIKSYNQPTVKIEYNMHITFCISNHIGFYIELQISAGGGQFILIQLYTHLFESHFLLLPLLFVLSK